MPVIEGLYSGTGPSERTILRTFFLSRERGHVATLEIEILSERVERGKGVGQTRKVIVELDDKRVSLEDDIDNNGITIDTGSD